MRQEVAFVLEHAHVDDDCDQGLYDEVAQVVYDAAVPEDEFYTSSVRGVTGRGVLLTLPPGTVPQEWAGKRVEVRIKLLEPRDLLDDELRVALLDAYTAVTFEVGGRLYMPVGKVRDRLKSILESVGAPLDNELDAILRRAPALLQGHTVTFSPFSGPAQDGLQLQNMYAGFISVRPKSEGAKRGGSP